MLTTIKQVNEQFFRLFHGIKVTFRDREKTVLCRYARKSSGDYSEEQIQQQYPCIAIQDYAPTPREEWFIDMHAYFGGVSTDGLKGYLYQRPIWMDFKYDVSTACKSYMEHQALQEYFTKHFVYGKSFLFNKKLDGELAVGDVVPYDVRVTDIPRNDGVFEVNYEFTCKVWLYPVDAEEVELIQRIVIEAEPTSL